MPAPMPPAAPQDDPSSQDPSQAPAGGADQFTELVKNLSNGMAMILDLSKSVSPEAAKMMDQANQLFQQAVQTMVQQGGGQPPQGGQGMASPETGGAAGAVPVGPGGR